MLVEVLVGSNGFGGDGFRGFILAFKVLESAVLFPMFEVSEE